MEGHVWCMIEELLGAVDGRPARCQYSNREILRVTLWAVLHDRPMSWACEAISWPETLRPARLPDDSTISRRWKGASLIEQADLLYETSLRRFAPGRDAVVDGRPLPVGGCSKDPDARAGRSAGGMGKGYKMHALVDLRHVILAYEVRPMNEAEQTVAIDLMTRSPKTTTRLLGDGAYDSMRLHRCVHELGKKLYTPLREKRVGRRQQPRRLQLLRLWARPIGRRYLKLRDEVERAFAQSTNVAIGFKGLPPWARRQQRVKRWIWGKNLIHHAWLLTRPRAA